jgi:DNA-binding MarR family transcriptional regulator
MMHLYVLGVLDEEGSIPMSRLAEVLDVSLSSTTGIVTRMEERRLVERTHDHEDRRVVLVGLTPAGREMAESIESAGRDHLARVLCELTPDELDRVHEAARLFAEAVRRHGERHHPKQQPVADPSPGRHPEP